MADCCSFQGEVWMGVGPRLRSPEATLLEAAGGGNMSADDRLRLGLECELERTSAERDLPLTNGALVEEEGLSPGVRVDGGWRGEMSTLRLVGRTNGLVFLVSPSLSLEGAGRSGRGAAGEGALKGASGGGR